MENLDVFELAHFNNITVRIFLVFCFSIIVVVVSGQTIDESQLVASMVRTTCYGKCPYYEIKFYANGMATYHGRQHVPYIGQYKANIGEKRVAELLERAIAIDYMALENKYPQKGLGIIDFPVCITMVRLKQKEKVIYSRNDTPPKLVTYQSFLDELVENVEWEKL